MLTITTNIPDVKTTKPSTTPTRAEQYRSIVLILTAQYRTKARSLGVPFELESEDVERISRRKCFICGAAPRVPFYTTTLRSELERISPSEGFTLANIFPSCRSCRQIRGTHNLLQLERLASMHRKFTRRLANSKQHGTKSTNASRKSPRSTSSASRKR